MFLLADYAKNTNINVNIFSINTPMILKGDLNHPETFAQLASKPEKP
jgi:hypothetical protein